MSVVDAHHHLWDPRVRTYPFLADPVLASVRRTYGLADLRERCRLRDVAQTVLVQTVGEVAETREFLEVAERSDGLIAGVVGWVDLEDPAVGDVLADLRRGPGGRHLVGIRHQAQDEPDDDWLARPRVVAGLRAVAAAGLCFDLLVLPRQLGAAVAAARAVPEGRFVLDHIAKPDLTGGDTDVWTRGLRELAQLPHVSAKLSGLVSLLGDRAATAAELRPFTDRVLDLFGAARLMVGSDWPVCDAVSEYDAVFALTDELLAGADAAERAHLFAETAIECYRLPVRS